MPNFLKYAYHPLSKLEQLYVGVIFLVRPVHVLKLLSNKQLFTQWSRLKNCSVYYTVVGQLIHKLKVCNMSYKLHFRPLGLFTVLQLETQFASYVLQHEAMLHYVTVSKRIGTHNGVHCMYYGIPNSTFWSKAT